MIADIVGVVTVLGMRAVIRLLYERPMSFDIRMCVALIFASVRMRVSMPFLMMIKRNMHRHAKGNQ